MTLSSFSMSFQLTLRRRLDPLHFPNNTEKKKHDFSVCCGVQRYRENTAWAFKFPATLPHPLGPDCREFPYLPYQPPFSVLATMSKTSADAIVLMWGIGKSPAEARSALIGRLDPILNVGVWSTGWYNGNRGSVVVFCSTWERMAPLFTVLFLNYSPCFRVCGGECVCSFG